MSLRTRVAEALRALMGYPKPAGHIVPDWRSGILGHPYRLDTVRLDYSTAVRVVGTVRACVMRKSYDISAQAVVIERETSAGWEPMKRKAGNAVDVWHGGNPQQTGREVVRDLHANFNTHGNAYLVAETFGGKLPKELWVMPSHLVSMIPGPRRAPSAFVFCRGGRDEEIPAENVIMWRDFQPEDEPVGASPLESVRMQYETRYDCSRLFQKVIRNGGVGAGYFKVPQPSSGIPVSLTEAEKEVAARQIRKAREKFDTPVILDMLEFERMGLTMDELKLIDSCALSDADICRALGVPPWLIGIKEGAKLGDSGQSAGTDERIYWMNLRTEIEFRDALMTERLLPMFGEEGARFRTDLSAVPALNAPLLNAAQQAVALAGKPVLTVNEVRRMNGLPAADDPTADELYIKPDPVPFGAAPAPAPANAPPEETGKPAAKSRRLIDTPERAERWKGKDALMRKYERKFESEYRKLVRERKSELLTKLEREGLRSFPAKRTIDLDAIFTPDEGDEDVVRRIFESLIAERGKEAAREIALELEINLQNRTVQEFIKQRQAVGLQGAMDTLLQEVRLSLAEGIGLGESLSELAARISTKFEDYEQGRVLTIVRTETVSAFNFASVEAWRQSGDVEQVEWLSARDSAVRETHAEADGQVVGITSAFDVGGASLEYPGDPAGPPEETINCRCVALPVVTERAFKRIWGPLFPSTNGHGKPTNRIKELVK